MATTTPQLTERRKADRQAMAQKLAEIAARHGATAHITVEDGDTTLVLRHPSSLQCYVWLERRSVQPDVHVIPWHLAIGCTKRLAPSFGDVNPYHGHKATHVACGWPALAAEIERGLRAAADGTAYA
ncbi:MAG TPA: hypothetical protein P5305_04010 [Rubrivivax sp.]|nr:hypothetical protein [Rubrivivax sp.]HRY87027.1 hypothetical protein [Rubrivivax sp.]